MHWQILKEKSECEFSLLPPLQQKDDDLHLYQKEA